jgi:hypothetical protein
MGLRIASAETTRIDLGDGAWADVAKDISKREFNRLAQQMPQDVEKITLGEATDFTKFLFTVFVKGWSLDVAPTVETYESLRSDDAANLDGKLMEHFNALTVSDDDTKKDKTSQKTS